MTNKNINNIPLLRFPEFSGEWEKNSLGKISTKNISYGVVQTGEEVANGVPCVRVVDLNEKILEVSKLITTSQDISQSYKKTILEKDELMIALRGVIGLTRIVNQNLVGCNLTRGVARVSPNSSQTVSKYLESYLNWEKLRLIFDQRKNGSALKEIPIGELKKIPIKYPTLPEQQKIADFLSSVDKKIGQLEEKKSLLEEYKKGVMQQLFSREIRFKADDGSEFEEWEERKLGEVCDKIQDGNYGFDYPKSDEFLEDGIPFLTSKALGSTGIIDEDRIDYISEEKHSQLKKAQLMINDVLFTNRGSNVGVVSFVDFRIANGNIGPQLTLLRASKKILPMFLKFSMQTYGFRKQVASQDSGSAMNFFGINATSKFKINIPSLSEQQKIAKFLTSLDSKIAVVGAALEGVKEWKKGLLQGMFV